MNPNRALVVALTFFLIVPRTLAQSEVEWTPSTCEGRIRGEITQELASGFLRHLSSSTNECRAKAPIIFFDSYGGDVRAAIRIGMAVRDIQAAASVPQGASCASACVLSFLGGVTRLNFGKIGLHRPYSTQLVESADDAQRNYEAINKLVAEYLRQMNIPARLLDEMNAIPPNYVRWYEAKSGDDQKLLAQLQVIGNDPAHQDQLDSAEARKYGVTKREYYEHKQKWEEYFWAVCAPRPNARCVSLPEYLRNQKK